MSSSSPSFSNSAAIGVGESSSLHLLDHTDDSSSHRVDDLDEGSVNENDLQRQLNDIESSFLPETVSMESDHGANGIDDTYMHLVPTKISSTKSSKNTASNNRELDAVMGAENAKHDHQSLLQNEQLDSPSAAAAHRNTSRSKVLASNTDSVQSTTYTSHAPSGERSDDGLLRSMAAHGSLLVNPIAASLDTDKFLAIPRKSPLRETSGSPFKRPAGKHSRQPSETSIISKLSEMSNDSDATISADQKTKYGGDILSRGRNTISRSGQDLSRLPSFGSVASEVSDMGSRSSIAFNRSFSATSGIGPVYGSKTTNDGEQSHQMPITPRAISSQRTGVTDTVIAQHVQNIQVPDTIAQDFRQRFRNTSPEKYAASNSSQRQHSTLTLKEQGSKIDKLTKENFDLKLKIHFLDQALQNRSDEGIKDMIKQNVDLQTDLAKERRDNQTLRRRVKELEAKLLNVEEELVETRDQNNQTRMASHEEMEIQIEELREKLSQAQVTITKLSAENLAKEMTRQRNSNIVDVKVKDEVELWKDLLTEEQGRREIAEDENRRLREEINDLKRNDESNDEKVGPILSSGISIENRERGTVGSRSSITLVEQLRHENVGLRRDLGAQSSMLSSRNKERERLQQEIEDLKLQHRHAGSGDRRSLAGDSILDRSASRLGLGRTPSRISAFTNGTIFSDAEREEYERREGLLRDENAQLRIECQECQRYIITLETDNKAADHELHNLEKQRDELIAELNQKDIEIEKVKEQFYSLQEQATVSITGLEEQVADYTADNQRLNAELQEKSQSLSAWQKELPQLKYRLLELEKDRNQHLKRMKNVEEELDITTADLENSQRLLNENMDKNQKLQIQIESLQSEVKFLREEQEADKAKIGELNSSLHQAQMTIQDEIEKNQDLQQSLIEERNQKAVLEDQSKQQAQKIITDLNAENTKSRDDVRKLRRNLSSKDAEALEYKSRLEELESHIREVMGDLITDPGPILMDIKHLHGHLAQTTTDLDATQAELAEKTKLLKSRDALLETSGLEARRLSDLFEKERQARKHDLHNFELSQRSNANIDSKSTEINQFRNRLAKLDLQYKDQLSERNNLLLTLWNRLSILCGSEWNHRISNTVNNLDSITKSLPDFQRNILAATAQVESLFNGLKSRIRSAERNMTKDITSLSSLLDDRIKRIDMLELTINEVIEVNSQLRKAIANSKMSTSSTKSKIASRSSSILNPSTSPQHRKLSKAHAEEANRLRAEVKQLTSELNKYRQSRSPSQMALDRLNGLDPDIINTVEDNDINGRPSTSNSGSMTKKHKRRSSMLGFGGLVGNVLNLNHHPNQGADDAGSKQQYRRSRDLDSEVGGESVRGTGTSSRLSMSPAASLAQRILHPISSHKRRNSLDAVRTLDFYSQSRTKSETGGKSRPTSISTLPGGPLSSNPPLNNNNLQSIQREQQITVSRERVNDVNNDTINNTNSGDVDKIWPLRYMELERRLKAEREARLLDRAGAGSRLRERDAENERLREELRREKIRSTINNNDEHDEDDDTVRREYIQYDNHDDHVEDHEEEGEERWEETHHSPSPSRSNNTMSNHNQTNTKPNNNHGTTKRQQQTKRSPIQYADESEDEERNGNGFEAARDDVLAALTPRGKYQ